MGPTISIVIHSGPREGNSSTEEKNGLELRNTAARGPPKDNKLIHTCITTKKSEPTLPSILSFPTIKVHVTYLPPIRAMKKTPGTKSHCCYQLMMLQDYGTLAGVLFLHFSIHQHQVLAQQIRASRKMPVAKSNRINSMIPNYSYEILSGSQRLLCPASTDLLTLDLPACGDEIAIIISQIQVHNGAPFQPAYALTFLSLLCSSFKLVLLSLITPLLACVSIIVELCSLETTLF